MIVGVTGGIGSGKSTVAARLAARGWPTIDADAVAREVVAPDGPALAPLVARFGDGILRPDGTLDRAELARLAFATDADRADLDAITHGHIAARIAERLATLRADPDLAVAVLDHPLLLETGGVDEVDVVVVVLADEDTRARRLVARGLDEADARARMRAQTDDATRRAAADHVIVNDGTEAALAAEADRVAAAIERDHVAGDPAGSGSTP